MKKKQIGDDQEGTKNRTRKNLSQKAKKNERTGAADMYNR
jgi:hypothetical protein